MTSEDGNALSFRDLYQQLRERSWQVLERGISRIVELAKMEQEKFRVLVVKMGDTLGDYVLKVAMIPGIMLFMIAFYGAMI